MDGGLRERKKAATRAALGRAAVRLATERGAERVTVEAIAAAAGVSPRTFHNYFPGRDEAIVAPLLDAAHRLVAELRARPAAEPVGEALRAAVRAALLPGGEPEPSRDLLRIVRDEPGLVGRHLCGLLDTQRAIAAIIGARTGTDPSADLYPNLVAGVAAAALRTSADLWLDAPDRDLGALVDEAFALLRTGLPAPHSPGP
ncbi:transcriptional regulator BetI [Actinomadura rubteroloni]|uniref:Transcriptional regulator BetI n=1 Tax=Actinomadura rubteroloni TaxID=1926885 RepID=A0A2P4UBP2_9ACTN|nr:transcriptional regulator BetI [Actinomadura rubteroloni]